MRSTKETLKRRLEFSAAVLLPVLAAAVVVAEHFGVFDRLAGLDEVEIVAARSDHSYGDTASFPVYPEDPAWEPTIALIKRYTNAPLRTDKQPQMLARWKASLSTLEPDGYEWTSPSTPFALMYERVPMVLGAHFNSNNVTIVGSIGDLHSWIAQRKSELHFLINDIFLSVMAVVLGYWLWRVNYLVKRPQQPG